MPEFAVANRNNIPVPDIRSMAEKCLAYFTQPHQVLDFTEEGRKHFMAYAACFSSEQSVLRNQDDPGAPRKGTAPWHLAVLSAAQLIFDLALGQAGRRVLQ